MEAVQPRQFLTFTAAGEQYALGVLEVREIVELRSLTAVPSAPRAVRGVVNLRGRVVPVVDLALHLGMPPAGITNRSCVVMVQRQTAEQAALVGILADAVNQVIDLPASELQPPPSFGSGMGAGLVKAMAGHGEKFVMVLDLSTTLDALGTGLDEVLRDETAVAEPEKPAA